MLVLLAMFFLLFFVTLVTIKSNIYHKHLLRQEMTSLTPDLAGWLMALFLLFLIIRKYDVSFYNKIVICFRI